MPDQGFCQEKYGLRPPASVCVGHTLNPIQPRGLSAGGGITVTIQDVCRDGPAREDAIREGKYRNSGNRNHGQVTLVRGPVPVEKRGQPDR